jgi:hypothetical protein
MWITLWRRTNLLPRLMLTFDALSARNASSRQRDARIAERERRFAATTSKLSTSNVRSWACRDVLASCGHVGWGRTAALSSSVARDAQRRSGCGGLAPHSYDRLAIPRHGREQIMKVGILGSGDVGKTLAAGFLKHGHQVIVGTRESSKLADWGRQHPTVRIGSFAEAATFGEVVVLSVKGSAAADAVRAAGADSLATKIVIDTTNPIADAPPEHGVLKFFTRQDESLLERLQQEFPRVHFVKAFNSVGSVRMVNPIYAGGRPTMFICGNDATAKRTVGTILEQFGWETADMGQVEAARAIEPLCILWCIPGFLQNQWTHAFKLLQ